MSLKIETNISSRLNTTTNVPTRQAEVSAKPVGEQVQEVLFGKPKPVLLDVRNFPDLAAFLKQLDRYRKRLARFVGDRDDDYELVLADGIIAMIDAEGKIYLGAGFLQAFKDQPEVVIGALAHEIGHRPKRWQAYKTPYQLTREQIEYICRHEETLADLVAGKALAELGLSCEPLVKFLQKTQIHPHKEYFSADVRAEIIRDAHAGRLERVKDRKKFFPQFARFASLKGDLDSL